VECSIGAMPCRPAWYDFAIAIGETRSSAPGLLHKVRPGQPLSQRPNYPTPAERPTLLPLLDCTSSRQGTQTCRATHWAKNSGRCARTRCDTKKLRPILQEIPNTPPSPWNQSADGQPQKSLSCWKAANDLGGLAWRRSSSVERGAAAVTREARPRYSISTRWVHASDLSSIEGG